MQSVSDITKVIVDDKPTSYRDDDDIEENQHYIRGNIILGISKDNSVHYNFFDGIKTRMKNNTLFLDNYHGELLLPKYCGLQILDSKRIISGLINYPIYLDSSEHINIMIEKTSGLEVLVSTMGSVSFNSKTIPKIVEGDSEKSPTLLGPDFEEYEERYTGRLELKKPKIVTNQFGTIADFGHLDNYELVEVCMKFNLAVIYTNYGDMSILYEGYTPKHHRSEFKILQSIRRSEHNLEQAYQSEDYRRIGQITKKLERLYIASGKKFLKPKIEKEKNEKINNKIDISPDEGTIGKILPNDRPNSNLQQ